MRTASFDGRTRRTLAVLLVVTGTATLVLLRVTGLADNSAVAVAAAVGCAGVMAISFRQRHRLRIGSSDVASASERVIVSESSQSIRDRLYKVVTENPKWTLKTPPDGDTFFEISTGLSVRSFGEVVEVRLLDIESSRTAVDIVSRSAVPTTMFDFGKNKANVVRIARAFKADRLT